MGLPACQTLVAELMSEERTKHKQHTHISPSTAHQHTRMPRSAVELKYVAYLPSPPLHQHSAAVNNSCSVPSLLPQSVPSDTRNGAVSTDQNSTLLQIKEDLDKAHSRDMAALSRKGTSESVNNLNRCVRLYSACFTLEGGWVNTSR